MMFRSGDGIDVGREFLQSREMDKEKMTCDDAPSPPHVCYLDPMFPPRTKSSAVKKKMQLLQGLLGEGSEDADQEGRVEEERALLHVALALAQRRVVVKRPIHAPPLGVCNVQQGEGDADGVEVDKNEYLRRADGPNVAASYKSRLVTR